MTQENTRTRYKVVAILVVFAAITYLDRIAISNLAPLIQKEFQIDKVHMGWIFTAFALAYAAFEVPSAWWGQKIGTRKVITRIVSWWSVFTIATAAVVSFPMMLVVRFLFGAGEAGAWPNAARTFSKWIPGRERGRVQAIFLTGAFTMGGLTPTIVSKLEPLVGWRGVFVCCGLVGFVWCFFWWTWFRDDPSEHPGVSVKERDMILAQRVQLGDHHGGREAVRKLASNPSSWFLCLCYFSNSYGSYFVMTWLPTYLAEKRGFPPEWLSVFAGLPMLLSAIAAFTGGVLTDWAAKKYGPYIGRSGVGIAGYIVAATAMVFAAREQDPQLAAIMLAGAFAMSMIPIGAHWASAIEIGKEHAGVLSATMNTTGQLGSISSPLVAAYLVQHYSNWALPLYVMAGLYACSAVMWIWVKQDR